MTSDLTVTDLRQLQEISDTVGEWNKYEVQIQLLLKKQKELDDAFGYDTYSK